MSQTRRKHAEYGSDVIVDLLKAYDTRYVFFNPGSSFRGIHDSLVNYGGNTNPEIIQSCHEGIAVSMAHGYANATGKPGVAIVHDTVGLQHATMAIYNAWCDRAPVIILGGNGPLDATRRRPRADWAHTALVPGNLVRDFVKWDDQPFSVASIPESLMRAYKIAMTPPRGPVYISYDVDLQEQKLSGPVTVPEVGKYAPPAPIQPNSEALRQAAQWLIEAKDPVIVADFVHRNQRVAEHLLELAELLAIPVVDRGDYGISLIPSHPMNASGAEREILERADVVLGLDASDLFDNLNVRDAATRVARPIISPKTKVIQISLDQFHMSSWACDLGGLQAVDLDILGDTSLALSQLIPLCRELIGQNQNKTEEYRERFERIRRLNERLRSTWKEEATKKRDDVPISVSRLAADVWQVIKSEDWLLVHDKVRSWNQRLWEWSRSDQWLGRTMGGGLGYSTGASIGAALAFKDSNKLCIDLDADGEFLYTASALWTAAHHQIPLLVVMYNNRSYYNSENNAQQIAKVRGRPESNKGIGTRIEQPNVDFAKLAQSFGVYGEGPIEKPEDIVPALRRAMKIVEEKKVPALVDVVTQAR